MDLFDGFASIAKPLFFGAAAYKAVSDYTRSREQAKQLKAQNARNAKLQEDRIRRARAQNLAALSNSGLSVTGTPLLVLQDEDAMMAQDLAYQKQTDASNESIASRNVMGTLAGNAAEVFRYGEMMK